MSEQVAEGWYVDPARPTFERWWTGTDWTDAFRPKSASKSFWAVDAGPVVNPPFPPPPMEYPEPEQIANVDREPDLIDDFLYTANVGSRVMLRVNVPNKRLGDALADTMYPERGQEPQDTNMYPIPPAPPVAAPYTPSGSPVPTTPPQAPEPAASETVQTDTEVTVLDVNEEGLEALVNELVRVRVAQMLPGIVNRAVRDALAARGINPDD